MSAESFICPRCATICRHPLEIYFRWCPKCKQVTGPPREIQARVQTPWSVIRDNQDDCMIAIQGHHPVPVAKLQALPPWRALMIAEIAWQAGVPLEHGTVEQLKTEASAVGGEGVLGRWWEREAS